MQQYDLYRYDAARAEPAPAPRPRAAPHPTVARPRPPAPAPAPVRDRPAVARAGTHRQPRTRPTASRTPAAPSGRPAPGPPPATQPIAQHCPGPGTHPAGHAHGQRVRARPARPAAASRGRRARRRRPTTGRARHARSGRPCPGHRRAAARPRHAASPSAAAADARSRRPRAAGRRARPRRARPPRRAAGTIRSRPGTRSLDRHQRPATAPVRPRRRPAGEQRPPGLDARLRAGTSRSIPPSVHDRVPGDGQGAAAPRGAALPGRGQSHAGIPWELLAACDWMQCEARPRYSPVHGEKLGAVNPTAPSTAPSRRRWNSAPTTCVDLAGSVYGIDLTARRRCPSATWPTCSPRSAGAGCSGAPHLGHGVPVLGRGPDRPAPAACAGRTSPSRTPPTSRAAGSGGRSGPCRSCWASTTRRPS